MIPPADELLEFCAAACELARRAGEVLLRQRAHVRRADPERKGRRDLVTAADREAEALIVSGLHQRFPEHGVLAEEGVATPLGRADRDAELTWVVDPLDGTTNFVHGIPFYGSALGLVCGGEPVVGVVHAPELATTFSAVHGQGARRDGESLHVSRTTTITDALLATGFSYVRNEPGHDDNTARIAAVIPRCRDLRRLGSAQLDLCLVAAGTFDGYWELDLSPWDMAAGAVVVREAGGRVSDLRGGDRWLHGGDVLASNGPLHDALLDLVGSDPRSR